MHRSTDSATEDLPPRGVCQRSQRPFSAVKVLPSGRPRRLVERRTKISPDISYPPLPVQAFGMRLSRCYVEYSPQTAAGGGLGSSIHDSCGGSYVSGRRDLLQARVEGYKGPGSWGLGSAVFTQEGGCAKKYIENLGDVGCRNWSCSQCIQIWPPVPRSLSRGPT